LAESGTKAAIKHPRRKHYPNAPYMDANNSDGAGRMLFYEDDTEIRIND
jgi:hypothetical protein